MLVPIVGLLTSMAFWSVWYPNPNPFAPGQPVHRRLVGALQFGLEAWAITDLVDAVASRYGHPVEETYPHTDYRIFVNFSDDHWHSTWTYGDREDVLIFPRVEDSVPLQPSSYVLDPDLYWFEEGVLATFFTPEVDEFPSRRIRLGRVSMIIKIWLVCLWWRIPWSVRSRAFSNSIAYLRRFIFYLNICLEWTQKYLEGHLQIALVQFVADGGPHLSVNEEVDLLIAGPRVSDEEILAWVKDVDSRPDSVFHVSILSQSGGIWIHRIAEGSTDALPLGIATETDCNTIKASTPTEDVRLNPVLPLTWLSPDVDGSNLDHSEAPADGEPEKSSEAEDRPPTLEKTKRRRNRPSQKQRHREGKRARLAREKELDKTLSESPVEASSLSAAFLSVSAGSTPLSALAPVFVPEQLVGEPQSGPLSSTPVPAQADTNLPKDGGSTSQDYDGSSRRYKRRPRRSVKPRVWMDGGCTCICVRGCCLGSLECLPPFPEAGGYFLMVPQHLRLLIYNALYGCSKGFSCGGGC